MKIIQWRAVISPHLSKEILPEIRNFFSIILRVMLKRQNTMFQAKWV